MAHTETSSPYELLWPRPVSGAFLEKAASQLLGILTEASRRMALRRARRELLELPDGMLKDMGITRGEIASVIEFGRDDPTRLAPVRDYPGRA